MPLKRQFAILLFYVLVGFLSLFTVIFTTGSRIPGQGATDYYHFSWSYWWVGHVLDTPGANLYETNYVIFPFTSNISYHTLAVFWFPLWAVTKPLLGALGAFNAISWTAFTLTGLLCYAFLRRAGVSNGLALLGGAALEVTPLMFLATWWTTPNLLGVFWYPAHLLIWGEVARQVYHRWKGWAWAGIVGAALWASLLTDMQYLLFLTFLLPPFALLTMIQSRRRVKLAALGGFALVVFLILSWWVGPLHPMLEFDHDKTVAAEGGLIWGIPFPDGYVGIPDYVRLYSAGGLITLAVFSALAVSLIRQTRKEVRRLKWFWFGVMLPPLILSAGMEITLAGTTIRMPYAWLHELTGGTFRAPGRLGPVFVFPALVFAGLAWTPVISKRLHVFLIPVLFWVLLAYHLIPIETQPNPPIYKFYKMMASETGDPYDEYVVLEVPVAVGDGIVTVGKPEDLKPMYYGSIHHKRMVTGHFSRAYLEYYWYLRTDHPVLSWLGQRRVLEPTVVEPLLREMIFTYPIGYIVIHQDAIGLETDAVQEIIGYFNRLPDLLCPIAVEDDAIAYRTAWHPNGCPARTPPEVQPGVYQVDVGADGDESYLGWGFYWPEYPAGISWRWMGAYPQAELYVDLPPADYEISLAVQSFWRERSLQLVVNGTALDTVSIKTDFLQEFTFFVPQKVIGDGKHIIVQFVYDSPDVPTDVGQSADPRSLALALDWIRFAAVDPPGAGR
ncbi:MAG: hypothetical protein KJ064_11705 [Anaerolineae bacterium]|nr:hypothetical protein [Anaerolineae bacterium]